MLGYTLRWYKVGTNTKEKNIKLFAQTAYLSVLLVPVHKSEGATGGALVKWLIRQHTIAGITKVTHWPVKNSTFLYTTIGRLSKFCPSEWLCTVAAKKNERGRAHFYIESLQIKL
jgi:hypothetical protein